MLPQSITNSLEINEKAENLSKETDVIKKKKKEPNGKNTITEIKKLTRWALVEWR